MEVKVWTKETFIQKFDISRDDIFLKKDRTLFFDHKKNRKFLEYLKLEQVNEKLRSYQQN
jgi:hypothetical protein